MPEESDWAREQLRMGEESGRSGHRWYQPDLNIDRDRPYLIGRGFAFAVIAEGDRRGKVVSAHRTRALAELAAKAFGGKKPPEIVEIATFA
jgi:hypothetical protein